MPTRYSRSPDTLCLSIRALRLSGEETPANSGFFCLLRLPGEVMWAGAVYGGKAGPQGQWCLTSLPQVSPVFRHTWKNSNFHLHCGSEFSVALTQKGLNLSVWLSHSSNFPEVMLCSMLGKERMGGIWAGARALLQLLPKPQWKWTGCQLPHTLETFLNPPLTHCSAVFKAFPHAWAYFSLTTLWGRQSTHYYQYHLQVIDFITLWYYAIRWLLAHDFICEKNKTWKI